MYSYCSEDEAPACILSAEAEPFVSQTPEPVAALPSSGITDDGPPGVDDREEGEMVGRGSSVRIPNSTLRQCIKKQDPVPQKQKSTQQSRPTCCYRMVWL